MKSREEVEELKKDWLQDGNWDIYTTEGFEEYEDELKEFQEKEESKWEKEQHDKLLIKADEFGCPGNAKLAEKILGLERRKETYSADAKKLLTHYFSNVMNLDHDNYSELSALVENIIDASISGAEAKNIKRNLKSN